ncbi:MAG: ABC transporter ATP-binding protein [Bacillota bacterium]|nr:ABC transporter ATP-binding protein [Bacillota bacterium]MDI3317569.1 ABC transporter ATP-binding protein [Bacillota bacterium]
MTKRFGGLVATHDVSFTVERGEVVFIIGPNGAGKTTLFNLITGYLRPDAGVIRFRGLPIQGLPPYRITAMGVGRTFQIPKPLAHLSVVENVMLGAFLRAGTYAEAERRALEVLERLEMRELARVEAGSLPVASLKRLEVARALATGAELLLLDEVVAGLSPAEADAFVGILRRLPEMGVTAVGGVEHIMRVVVSIADRVIVLDHGTRLAAGRPEEVVRDPAVVEAYLGTKFARREEAP